MILKIYDSRQNPYEVKAYKITRNWYVTRSLPGNRRQFSWGVTHKPTRCLALILNEFSPTNKKQLNQLKELFEKWGLGSKEYDKIEPGSEKAMYLKNLFQRMINEAYENDEIDFYMSIYLIENL